MSNCSLAEAKCVQIGSATLYLGDCREILPTLGQSDLVLTDPPYGIGRDGKPTSTSKHGGHKGYEFLGWDEGRPTRDAMDLVVASGRNSIIWGGNYFADMLPATGKWLVWDKGQRIDQADGELAWTSFDSALRIFTLNRVALMKDGAQHPTQKPVALMKWCIHQAGEAATILDPYMGSGSAGVAAIEMGRTFVGIEREAKYFDIAVRRIGEATKQPDMFAERTTPARPQIDFLAPHHSQCEVSPHVFPDGTTMSGCHEDCAWRTNK